MRKPTAHLSSFFWFSSVAGLALLSAAVVPVRPQLAKIHTVYVLPMSHGMDQYLANRVTQKGIFQIVTDPLHADAVLTDHLGRTFEQNLKDIYEPPPPKPERKAPDSETTTALPMPGSMMADDGKVEHPFTLGASRGTYYLVDPHSKQVVWSIFLRPNGYSPSDLNHIASKLVSRLQRDLEPPKTE